MGMGEVSGRRGAKGVAEWAEAMVGARSTAAGLTGHGGRGISFTIYRPPRPVSPTTHGSIIRRRFRPFPDPGELASFTTPASCEGGDAMARDMHDPRGGRRATKAVSAVMRYWRSWARFYRTVQRVLFKLLELRDRELHDAGIYSCAA